MIQVVHTNFIALAPGKCSVKRAGCCGCKAVVLYSRDPRSNLVRNTDSPDRNFFVLVLSSDKFLTGSSTRPRPLSFLQKSCDYHNTTFCNYKNKLRTNTSQTFLATLFYLQILWPITIFSLTQRYIFPAENRHKENVCFALGW
jgi:hypothetical protein